jgi:hypothetical protein
MSGALRQEPRGFEGRAAWWKYGEDGRRAGVEAEEQPAPVLAALWLLLLPQMRQKGGWRDA